jgi:hypothetical protein
MLIDRKQISSQDLKQGGWPDVRTCDEDRNRTREEQMRSMGEEVSLWGVYWMLACLSAISWNHRLNG